MAKPKFKFGAAPKNFLRAVSIQMIDGEESEIEFSFIYRTRKEFAAMIDANIAAAAEKSAAELKLSSKKKPAGEGAKDEPNRTVTNMFHEVDQFSAAFVMKIADGWDLDDPFTEESLLKLEDENPGSLVEIGSVYRQAVAEHRTKN
jgi:hypothetical protein